MGAADIISLIVQVGYPLAVKLIDKVFTNTPVTSQDWEGLKADAKRTASDRMRQKLVDAGIDPTSPQGIALLAAT